MRMIAHVPVLGKKVLQQIHSSYWERVMLVGL
jgi:hypothetical protein